MTIAELNTRLDANLRAFIKLRDHILTGAMYRSVMFDCSEIETGLQLRFSSMYYIKFLDHGEFINDFYNLESTNAIITDYIAGMIEREI